MRLLLLAAAFTATAFADLVDQPQIGVRLASGFSVEQFSDERLANDIWCLTFNPRGEVVVSGAGYIKTLRDTDGDGRADSVTVFAKTVGAMGMCFDQSGRQLLAVSDGWFVRYRDDDLDGIADGEPEKLLPMKTSEHGGHAIRQGPDGWWYVIGGNDALIGAAHNTLPSPIIPNVEAGALIRLPPDLGRDEQGRVKCQVIAHGFRNPYDFDFNGEGDIFTYDSDCERDYFLPWYSGCRVYRVGIGEHHGWKLRGYQRSFRLPDYRPDVVPALAEMGRGSPTGVVCYRHSAFPATYRGGLFIADWTFGRIYFLPLDLADGGSGYSTKPEVFIEPIGNHGFAPTDLAVASDGALFVSIGGRKTRGGVFRIRWAQNSPGEPRLGESVSDVNRAPVVLDKPLMRLRTRTVPEPRLARLVAIQEALGGWRYEGASAEALVPYEVARPAGLTGEERTAAASDARSLLAAGDATIEAEAARVLAMLEDEAPESLASALAHIRSETSATTDLHYLACCAKLRAPWKEEQTAKIAQSILDLDRKLAGGDRRPKQNWAARLSEIVAALIQHNSNLVPSVIRLRGFATPGHLALLDALPRSSHAEVARLYLDAVRHDPHFEWSPQLVRLLAEFPEPDVNDLLLGQWKSPALRPELRRVLGSKAPPEDSRPDLVSEADAWKKIEPQLSRVDWAKGDAARGERVFRDRSCASCHAGSAPFGPDLAGVAQRLAPVELIHEIVEPSRNIAEAFRATAFRLRDGREVSGLVAFVSADGVIAQTGPGITERFSDTEIIDSEPARRSLMPAGLLAELAKEEIADLVAYLRTQLR